MYWKADQSSTSCYIQEADAKINFNEWSCAAATVVVQPSLLTLDVVFFCLFFLSYHLSCIRPVPASHRDSYWHGFGFLTFVAWRLACVAAPPSCYSHATHMLPDLFFRSPTDHIMPQRPDFSSPSAHTYPRTLSQPHLWTCNGVRPREMWAPTSKSSHKRTEEFCFCVWKERTVNSCQLEVPKPINYRVTLLKESKRAALCLFSLWERGWRICQDCCADQQTVK